MISHEFQRDTVLEDLVKTLCKQRNFSEALDSASRILNVTVKKEALRYITKTLCELDRFSEGLAVANMIPYPYESYKDLLLQEII